MNIEIEARLLDINTELFINKIESCGAKFIGDWLQIRYCYDFHPVKENSWIRLRTNGKETTLTIKEISSSAIDGTKEFEISVSDFTKCDEILNKLGYFARSKQENRRIRYLLNDVEIDIDKWPKIPDYVEFEADSVDKIKSLCKILDIDFETLTTLDVDNIYKQYGYDLKQMPILMLEEDRKKNVADV